MTALVLGISLYIKSSQNQLLLGLHSFLSWIEDFVILLTGTRIYTNAENLDVFNCWVGIAFSWLF